MLQLSTFTQTTALMASTLPIIVRETLEDYADFDIGPADFELVEALRTKHETILDNFSENYSQTLGVSTGSFGRDGSLLIFHRRIAHCMPEGFRTFLDRAANDQWYDVIDQRAATIYYFERLARALETGAMDMFDLSELAPARRTRVQLRGHTALRVETLSDFGLRYEDIGASPAERSDRSWLDRHIGDLFAQKLTIQEQLALVTDIGFFQFKATEEQRLVVLALLERLLPYLDKEASLEAAYYLIRAVKDNSILVQGAAFDVLFNIEDGALTQLRQRALISACNAEDQELRRKAEAFLKEVQRERAAEMNKDQVPIEIVTDRLLD